MLTILGQRHRFCDNVSRRNFLKIGALGMGGMALPQLLRAEAASGQRPSHKAIIMIFLPGGPSHQDIFDLKMNAPQEIRGEFSPIATNVPGIQIGEVFPRIARIMDKCVVIRSVVGAVDRVALDAALPRGPHPHARRRRRDGAALPTPCRLRRVPDDAAGHPVHHRQRSR